MVAQREPRELLPPPSQMAKLREAADAAIFDLGGYQTVADRLHTTPAFLRKLLGSRRGADLRELVLMVGRVRAAVEKARKAGGQPPNHPQPHRDAPPLLPVAERELRDAAQLIRTANMRLVAVIGLPFAAKRLEMEPERLAARLLKGDAELALMIEAVLIPDLPDIH